MNDVVSAPEPQTAEERKQRDDGAGRFLPSIGWAVLIIAVLLMSISITLNTITAAQTRQAAKVAQAAAADARVSALQVKETTSQNQKALCGIKENAQAQVERTADFLAENPGDVRVGNTTFTRAELVDQLESQRAFRDTLNGVDCE